MASLRVLASNKAPMTFMRTSNDSFNFSESSAMPNAPSVMLKNFSNLSSCLDTPFFMQLVKEKLSDKSGSSVATTSNRLPPVDETVKSFPACTVARAPVGSHTEGSARYISFQTRLLQSKMNASLMGFSFTPPYSIREESLTDSIMANARASGMPDP